MSDDRRLIEDYLPIQAISAEASREKSVRKGHISTLHLWWARRPLVACRAAVYGALVPADRWVKEVNLKNPPGDEAKAERVKNGKKLGLNRKAAKAFVERLCRYPSDSKPDQKRDIEKAIAEAQQHILEAHADRLTQELTEAKNTGKVPAWVEEFKFQGDVVRYDDIVASRAPRPRVLDMFAGGGAIPLEALRLGCEAYALDLNPVAHIIQLCTLVYPQKYGRPDPTARGMTGPKNDGGETTWGGLAEEVRYWGNWVLKKVKAEIGDLYPLIPDPAYKGKRGRTGVSPVMQGELVQTRRHLPHWQIGGSVYFVTFSTRKIPLSESCRKIILDACRYWDGKKVRLHLTCVMPDHVHAIVEPLKETEDRYYDLAQVLHSIKSYTAHEVNRALGRTGPLWEEESWDRIIRDEDDYWEKWNYIVNNPPKAGLSQTPEAYPFLYRNEELASGETPDMTGETPVIPPPPGYLVPIAYLWTRTVRCKNPACRATVPLLRQTWLCKKQDRYVALRMLASRGRKSPESPRVRFEVVEASTEKALGFDPAGFSKAGNATCPFCGTVADSDYVKAEGRADRIGTQPMAIVCTRPGARGKVYLAADSLAPHPFPSPSGRGQGEGTDDDACRRRIVDLCQRTGLTLPHESISPLRPSPNARGLTAPTRHGLTRFADLFHPRQLLSLLTQCEAVCSAIAEMRSSGIGEDRTKAVAAYLAIVVDRMADRGSSLCRWDPGYTKTQSTFGRPALPFVWDFSETNPFGDASGDMTQAIDWVAGVIEHTRDIASPAKVERGSATTLEHSDSSMDAVVTDPPYYDNVPYADLSDFFYVWLRRSIGNLFPEHFTGELAPKKSEATALSSRHSGDMTAASADYEGMMLAAFRESDRVLKPGGQLVVVYAHKTTLGWATLVEALRQASYTVTEAWPLDTEFSGRLMAQESAALATSIFLVGRKREGNATGSYETDVQPELAAIVRERVETLWDQGISGADLVIACVGAGLRAFTKYEKVEYANGEEVPAARFLTEVETVVLDSILRRLSKEVGGNGGRTSLAGVDPATRFYLLWRYTYRNAELDAGEAIIFANGTHVELDGQHGMSSGARALIEKKKAKYRLRDFTERGDEEKLGLPNEDGQPAPLIDALHRTLWLMEHRPTQLGKFLREAEPNREQMRLVAQALAGPALKGGEMADISTTGELSALSKLTSNWRSVVEDNVVTPGEQADKKRGQKRIFE